MYTHVTPTGTEAQMLKHKAFETVAESCLDHLSEETSHVEPNPMDRSIFFFLLHNHLVPKSSLCLGQIESSLCLSSTSNIPEKEKSFNCSLRMIEIQSRKNKQTKQSNSHTHTNKNIRQRNKQTQFHIMGTQFGVEGAQFNASPGPPPDPFRKIM